MIVLAGLDFETSGLDHETDAIVEASVVLWNADAKRMLTGYSVLVWGGARLDDERWDEAQDVHGVSQDACEMWGIKSREAAERVAHFVRYADAAVAHNGSLFDRRFYDHWLAKEGVEQTKTPWIDTRLDLPAPMIGKLTHIAADHGFLNPFPHNGLADVLTMLRVLSEYDLSTVLERARTPNIRVYAHRLPFANKDLAKDRGYYADYTGGRFQCWAKIIKLCDFEKERQEAGFEVRIAEEEK